MQRLIFLSGLSDWFVVVVVLRRSDTMTILENLYHGNINPCELEQLQKRSDYKDALVLVNRVQEKIEATLDEEQKKLFENYTACSDKLSLIIEEEIFKEGFRLAVKIMMEIG